MNYKETYEIDGKKIDVWKIDHDVNGNPRYVVHYLSLGLTDYKSIAAKTPMNIYQGKWFGGGYVFQSYDVATTLRRTLEIIEKENL